ncbi:MAG: radical SAM protein, partial [Candidatus Omnitrophica bacterium]|nr:radical SAM protein [Candidatus Omnitrophota bacterium]
MSKGVRRRSFEVIKQLALARFLRRRIPVKVVLQVTKHCPMRCNYCYTDFDAYNGLKDKTTKEVCAIIDDIYGRGARWLHLLGGEPTVRPDLGEIVDYAHGKNMFVDMNSNGILINERNVRDVLKLDAVAISIDGDEESNDYYRGRGNYRKALEAVKLLRKHGMQVRIHAILTRRTARKLDHMVKLAGEFDTSFNYAEVSHKQPDADDPILTGAEAEEFYAKYIDYKKKGAPIAYSLAAMQYRRRWPKTEDLIMRRDEAHTFPADTYVRCLSGDIQCFLDIDGRMYACNGTWGDGLNVNEVG